MKQREDLTRRLGKKPGSRRTLAGVIPKSGSALQEGAPSAHLGQHGVYWDGDPGWNTVLSSRAGWVQLPEGGLGRAEEHASSPRPAQAPEPHLGTYWGSRMKPGPMCII